MVKKNRSGNLVPKTFFKAEQTKTMWTGKVYANGRKVSGPGKE